MKILKLVPLICILISMVSVPIWAEQDIEKLYLPTEMIEDTEDGIVFIVADAIIPIDDDIRVDEDGYYIEKGKKRANLDTGPCPYCGCQTYVWICTNPDCISKR